jgi:hypothetical protein
MPRSSLGAACDMTHPPLPFFRIFLTCQDEGWPFGVLRMYIAERTYRTQVPCIYFLGFYMFVPVTERASWTHRSQGINNWKFPVLDSTPQKQARLHTRACVDPPLFHNFVLWLSPPVRPKTRKMFELQLDSDTVRRKFTFRVFYKIKSGEESTVNIKLILSKWPSSSKCAMVKPI